jgi:hypothetical protein
MAAVDALERWPETNAAYASTWRAGSSRSIERTAREISDGRRQLSWPVDDNYLGRLRA